MRVHSKPVAGGSAVNTIVAVVLVVGSSGPEVITVSSGVTVQVWLAGVASTRPATFLARTRRVCSPANRPLKVVVGSQEPQSSRSSSAHSKVANGSLDEKAKSASIFTVVAGGPKSMDVSGTAETVAVTMAKGERLPGSPHITPVSGSWVVVTSTQALPSKCSSRTGSATEPGV